MSFWKTLVSVIVAVLTGLGSTSLASDANDVPQTMSLSGADWFIYGDASASNSSARFAEAASGTAGWIKAEVPGNIQADLEAAHRLTPLWYGAGDPRLYDVALKDWWYRKNFFVPASFRGKRLRLVFDGVDDTSDVYVNGVRVGGNAGMFRRFEFDVAKWIKPGLTNHLAVRIHRMPKELLPYVIQSDGSPLTAAPGTPGYFPTAIAKTRQVLGYLKSTTNFGWDWGVDIWTLGIWKNVRLEATGQACIEWTQVQTKLEDHFQHAKVMVHLHINSLDARLAQVVLQISGHGKTVSKTIEVQLKQGDNLVTAQLQFDHPALWWPNGQGDQPLYELRAQISGADRMVMDARTTRFGIRQIRWEEVQGAPTNFVNRFRLVINGRPVRTMGSCLVPPDLLFGRIMERGPELLRRAKAAGMNTLRIWGGGVILPKGMYDLADRLGIMLSQEFPISIDGLPTNQVFLDNLDETTRNIVRQLRNHPSIIEWTGGNELNWRHGSTDPAYQVVRRAANEEDDRVFRPTSPITGSTHGPYVYDATPGYYQHYNDLSTMRHSEFGAQSPANLNVWRKTIPPSSAWPIHGTDNPILQRKNVVMAVFFRQLWLDQPVIDRVFGPPGNLPALVRAGQFLGAEGLRYAMDALRLKGGRIGGMTSWDFNEPWPNGAGSYMVDYYGQPLMNYDWVREALAPVSLCLRYSSLFYDPAIGMKAELMLVSDAPQPMEGLRWRWLARDRRGRVFAKGEGKASIVPQQVVDLGAMLFRAPAETARGPVFVEMQLTDANGKRLTERLYVFAARGFSAPLAGLLDQHLADVDDNAPPPRAASTAPDRPINPKSTENLAYVGNGAKPATASSARPEPYHQPAGLNDGQYGNRHSWIGTTPRAWFEIDLNKTARIGQFRLGRDRTSHYTDRGLNYLKIQTSVDHVHWQTVFERSNLVALAGFSPNHTMIVDVAPVEARWVRVTVDPKVPRKGLFACIDEFEIYAPQHAANKSLPLVTFMNSSEPALDRPVRRTTLRVTAMAPRIEGNEEELDLVVTNTGAMTALFCRPHPLIAHRTDLFIGNRNCFVPPGESRTITIRAKRPPPGGLTLAQNGWRLTAWNADDVVIQPAADVLLAVGCRDQMCREFQGCSNPDAEPRKVSTQTTVQGQCADASAMPYLLGAGGTAAWTFEVDATQAARPARLELSTADQSADVATVIEINVNGASFLETLAKGLGVQRRDPAHLAFPQTLTIDLPTGTLHAGKNTLKIHCRRGWLTWDAIGLRAFAL